VVSNEDRILSTARGPPSTVASPALLSPDDPLEQPLARTVAANETAPATHAPTVTVTKPRPMSPDPLVTINHTCADESASPIPGECSTLAGTFTQRSLLRRPRRACSIAEALRRPRTLEGLGVPRTPPYI
jgi:hypothetical protein